MLPYIWISCGRNMLSPSSGLKCVEWGIRLVIWTGCKRNVVTWPCRSWEGNVEWCDPIGTTGLSFLSNDETHDVPLKGNFFLPVAPIGTDLASFPYPFPWIWVTKCLATCLYSRVSSPPYSLQSWRWRQHTPLHTGVCSQDFMVSQPRRPESEQ
jgi:hypothetical protein